MTRISPNKILRYDMGEIGYPIHLQIDPFGGCSHDCIWCFFKGKYDPNMGVTRTELRKYAIDTESILKVLDNNLFIKAVTFVGGGEPTLHPDFVLICQKLIGRDIPFGVITNLATISGPKLVGLSFAKWVRVSLDAMTEETHDKLHRPKAEKYGFSTVVENVKYLSKHTTVGISFLVHPDNFTEIALIADYVEELGFAYIQFKPVYTKEKGKLYSDGMYGTIQKLIDGLRRKCPQLEIIDLFSNYLNKIAKTDYPDVNCKLPSYRIQIGSDGNVYPCCYFKYVPEYAMGNIKDYKFLHDLLSSKKAKKILDNLDISKCPPCYDKDTQVTLHELDNMKDKKFV